MDDNIWNELVAPAVRTKIKLDESALLSVILEVRTDGPKGVAAAKAQARKLAQQAIEEAGDRTEQGVSLSAREASNEIYARLQGKVIRHLVELDLMAPEPSLAGIRPDLDDGQIFNPDNLIKTVIALPLLRKIEDDESLLQSVLIDLNLDCAMGREQAKAKVRDLIERAVAEVGDGDSAQAMREGRSTRQYVFARLQGKVIRRLIELDLETAREEGGPERSAAWRAIHHIWPDFKVRAQIWKSVATVKGDACRRSFATSGKDIVWAVLDSGIDGSHPHFEKYRNLDVPAPLKHMDFTPDTPVEVATADLKDEYGHGTHVAGIIAGELDTDRNPVALTRERDAQGVVSYRGTAIDCAILGVAPQCKLLSYRVLDERGDGEASTVISAIQSLQEINGHGRRIIVHGVNLSLGYDFDPEWFACGQSPLCVEVDRLVRSGVAVVIAAGNTGKGFALTINDPGNAELAITVGATHRDMPHRYGVSYFSSKGPTGDGRRKPDLLAPGERIVSCGAGVDLGTYQKKAGLPVQSGPYYLERSGTSMAAPHVSGILAGILSVRSEFVGQPEELKRILVENATDLKRDPSFQGGGLVDMMRAIQAI